LPWISPNGVSQIFVGDTVFDVMAFGAKGDGVTDDTAAIVAATTAAVSRGKTLFFPAKTFVYSTSMTAWNTPGLRIHGSGETILKFTGTGKAIDITGPLYDVSIENMTIRGTATATHGVYLNNVHHSVFRDVSIQDVPIGMEINFGVLNRCDNLRVSSNERTFLVTPSTGVLLDSVSSANIFNNLIVEGVSGSGVKLTSGIQNTFIGGTSEGNGTGIELAAASDRNTFINMDLEANTVRDINCSGAFNVFQGMLAASTTGETLLNSGANNNLFQGGEYHSITVSSGAQQNTFLGVNYSISGAGGTFTDSGGFTTRLMVGNAFSGGIEPATFRPSHATSAPVNIPHGTAPSSPVNGDMWTTTAGLFVRVNGVTVGPLS
jgi:hypothetical protein